MSQKQFPVNVLYSTQNGLSVQPNSVPVGKGEMGKIVWTPGGGVDKITTITIGDDWPYSQPAEDPGAKTWSADDPNGTKMTYKYTISAQVSGGEEMELDPEIVNEGTTGA